jgi:hypothetical protein
LNYATIDEYKEPIYELFSQLTKEKLMKAADYKQYKRQILTEARIELKRQVSKKINSDAIIYDYNNSSTKYKVAIYVKLLFPFKNDKNVANFLFKLKFTDSFYAKSMYIALQIENKNIFNP